MNSSKIHAAAELLAKSRRDGRFLNELPEDLKPRTFADAAAIQVETARLLDEPVVAYKVSGVDPAQVIWGAILGSRFLKHPAQLLAAYVPLLGVEAEIAYLLKRDVEARDRSMTIEQFDEMTSVVPAIEIVDSRFLSYEAAPVMDRNADFMSNGALVVGDTWPESATTDFSTLRVGLSSGDKVLAATEGGHSAGDPQLPALAFLRAPHRPDRLPAGTVITTGTLTGLKYVQPGDTVTASFAGYGTLEVSFTT